MRTYYFLLVFCILSINFIQAQNVGIGTASPNASALLEVNLGNSSSKGVLISGTYNASSTIPDLGGVSRMMFYPGKAAFRAGYPEGSQWNNLNVGLISVAMGYGTTASGIASTAIGQNTIASGSISTAMGNFTIAGGQMSTTMGRYTNASGLIATAMGNETSASGDNSTAMGDSTTASGTSSVAMGIETVASGNGSTAMGGFSTASGSYSTSMGRSTAIGSYSSSMGYLTDAKVYASTAMGGNTSASGYYSTTMGYNTIAKGYASTVIGQYNDSIFLTDHISVYPTTPLLVVGNGSTNASRSNALVVLKNGNVGIGTSVPTNALSFPPVLGKKISLYPGGSGDAGFAVQGNQLLIYSDNPGAWVRIGYDQAGVFTNNLDVYGNGNAWLRGTLTQNSDMRLKKNINQIINVLPSLLQISGYNYHWKNEKMDASMQSGVSAQEVQKVFPELVKENDEGTLSVNYTGLIPYLIEAAKEQQQQVNALKSENLKLKGRLDKLEKLLVK